MQLGHELLRNGDGTYVVILRFQPGRHPRCARNTVHSFSRSLLETLKLLQTHLLLDKSGENNALQRRPRHQRQPQPQL
jgi:hypothetical protein